MDGQLPQGVLNSFDLKVKNVKLLKNHVYMLDTDRGLKCLKLYGGHPEQFSFVVRAADHLAKQGFKKAVRFIRNKYGEPFTNYFGQIYCLTDWVDGKPLDFLVEGSINEVAKNLAKFHQAARSLNKADNFDDKPWWGRWLGKLRLRTSHMAEMVSYIRAKPQKNRSDVLILTYFPEQFTQARQCLARLIEFDLRPLVQQAAQRRTFCHRDYNAHNLLKTTTNDIFVLDLDHCAFEMQAYDLARLLLATLVHHKWSPALGQSLLEAYQKNNPIDFAELTLIFYYLSFPHEFWLCLNRYYQAQANEQGENASIQFRHALATQQARSEFLKQMGGG